MTVPEFDLTTPEGWAAREAALIEQQRQETEAALAKLVPKLQAAGIIGATAAWTGSGDEGSIYEVVLLTPDGTPEQSRSTDALEREVEEMFDGLIDMHFGNYGDGDGGEGYGALDTKAGVVRLEHGWHGNEAEYGQPIIVGSDGRIDADATAAAKIPGHQREPRMFKAFMAGIDVRSDSDLEAAFDEWFDETEGGMKG